MPNPSKLPDDGVLLRERYVEGLSFGEIADRHGVHKSNVSRRFGKIGESPGGNAALEYRDYLPWQISRENLPDLPALMLYAHIRHAVGIEVPQATMSRLRGWWSKLTKDHTVLSYDPTREKASALAYVPRTDADGRLVIRWPADVHPPTESQKVILTLPKGF